MKWYIWVILVVFVGVVLLMFFSQRGTLKILAKKDDEKADMLAGQIKHLGETGVDTPEYSVSAEINRLRQMLDKMGYNYKNGMAVKI